MSPCCWCARPIRGPDRLTDIDSRRDGKSSRCRHSIAGHVATAQRCGQQAESQPQVCSMNTFPSQRDCCFVSTSALFGLDTNALPLQRKLKLSARNPCRPCPRHPLKRRYVAPWRLGQPPRQRQLHTPSEARLSVRVALRNLPPIRTSKRLSTSEQSTSGRDRTRRDDNNICHLNALTRIATISASYMSRCISRKALPPTCWIARADSCTGSTWLVGEFNGAFAHYSPMCTIGSRAARRQRWQHPDSH
ncbi:hypothetical protein RN06_1101 [Mycobacterium tuberculosis variant bovis BCG]|nr:hypothetical protein RN06_1101 [Mycobacterium tuberculosis variant bovis BCG]